MSDWKNIQYKDGKMRTSSGGGGGASALSDLTDVDLTNIADGQILKWDATNSKWVNANESGGGSGHTYSETEHQIGTWIDGKPVYEKVYIITSVTTNTNYKIADFPTNMNEIIKLEAILKQSSNTYVKFNWAWGTSEGLRIRTNSNGIEAYIASTYSGIQAVRIYLQYTKTTD